MRTQQKMMMSTLMIATSALTAATAFSSSRVITSSSRFRSTRSVLQENKSICDGEQQTEMTPQLPPLVVIGDRELHTPCQPFDDDIVVSEIESDAFQQKLEMLKECQKTYGGIGIAACQVGWRARVFCMGIDDDNLTAKTRYPDAPNFVQQFWINPTITIKPCDQTKDTTTTTTTSSWFWEGCLSVPGMRGWVERPTTMLISGHNERGKYIHEQQLDGLPARVAQHEYDHLDGILFPDRALSGTLLPTAAFDNDRQDKWPVDWPTRGSRNTKPGGFSVEK